MAPRAEHRDELAESELLDPEAVACTARVELVGDDPVADLLDGRDGQIGELLDLGPITLEGCCRVGHLIHPST